MAPPAALGVPTCSACSGRHAHGKNQPALLHAAALGSPARRAFRCLCRLFAPQVNRVPIGNIGDLRTVTVQEIGGVPVAELQKSVKGLRGGQ